MSYHQDRDETPQDRVRRDPIVRTKTIPAQRRQVQRAAADGTGDAARRDVSAAHARGDGHQGGKKRKPAPKRERIVLLMILASVALIFLFDALCSGKPQPRQASVETEQQMQTAPETPETDAPAAQPEQQVQTAEPAQEGNEAAAEAEKTQWTPQNPSVKGDLLAEYHAQGVGSENRFHNLKQACSSIDGYLLQSGAHFSFNEVVGERSAERGYLEASIYTTASNSVGYGGGICQVSSALYVCALQADLQIDSRSAHMYTVEYVPYGLDATVNWDNIDFAFTNSTDYPLEIQAEADETGVTVRLLGTKTTDTYIEPVSEIVYTYYFDTTEEVDYSKPSGYSEWKTLPHNGYDTCSYQDIYSADGTLLEHRFVARSHYEKADLIITVGP